MNVTVVTAAFRAELMDRVVESIRRQTHPVAEWIIVNDAQEAVREWYEARTVSGDLERLPAWFVDIEKHKNRFGLYSRNVGAMLAKYDRILYLDDDNEFTEDHVESMVKLEEETGKIPYCDIHIKGKKPGSTHERIRRCTLARQNIDLGCILYRKEHFEKYGYFRDDAQVTFDWNMISRIVDGEGKDAFAPTRKTSLIFHHKRY